MLAVYVFLFILGGGLAALSLLGDAFGDAGGLEADLDVDMDVAVGADAAASAWWKAFSIQGVIYGALGAGMTGTLLHLLWDGGGPILTGILAAGAGLGSGGIAATFMNYLKRSGSGEVASESSFEGRLGAVTLPLRPGVPGRIRVRRGSREHVLRALPFGRAAEESDPTAWSRVVVVEVKGGVAYVTPATKELDALPDASNET